MFERSSSKNIYMERSFVHVMRRVMQRKYYNFKLALNISLRKAFCARVTINGIKGIVTREDRVIKIMKFRVLLLLSLGVGYRDDVGGMYGLGSGAARYHDNVGSRREPDCLLDL